MPGFSGAIHRLAEHFGFRLSRIVPHAAPSLPSYLCAEKSAVETPLHAICFDNDAWLQAQLFIALPTNRVRFISPTLTPNEIGKNSLKPPAATRFITVADLELTTPVKLITDFPWLADSQEWLLRARLGTFWMGELDLESVAQALRPLGLHLTNVLTAGSSSVVQTPATNVLLVFGYNRNSINKSARFRLNEALAFLSKPIARRGDFRLIAGRGSYTFGAGIFNPGAIEEKGDTYLLSRAEYLPWADQKNDASNYFSAVTPMLFTLGADCSITSARPVRIEGTLDTTTHRMEDFRLFRFRQTTFVNCTIVTSPSASPASNLPVPPKLLRARVGISQLDVNTPRLTWLGHAEVDFPLADMEKNWGFFSNNEQLFILYSFAPYRLLRARNWPALDFVTEIAEAISLPIDGDGLAIRNSINPVNYDNRHLLHVVHKVYPNKQYSFWAVLLSKETLRPARITIRPLARAWHSASTSILYCCSAMVGVEDISIFAGWDDSSTAIAVIPRARLDSEWVDL